MRKLSALALATAMSVATAGCLKHTYTFGRGGKVEKAPTESVWQSHWFLGMIGDDNVKIDTICPTWDATIKNEMTFRIRHARGQGNPRTEPGIQIGSVPPRQSRYDPHARKHVT